MGADTDAVQGAVVLVGAVVGALLYGAFNAFVRMTAHKGSSKSLLYYIETSGRYGASLTEKASAILEKEGNRPKRNTLNGNRYFCIEFH